MTPNLIQLVYISTAKLDDIDTDLHKIQGRAVRHNNALNITGVLLHRSGRFIQLLEGEPARVDALYESIMADPRHADVRLLVRRPCAQRTASAWSMGVLDLDGLSSEFEPTIATITQMGEESHTTHDDEAATKLIGLMTALFAGCAEAA